MAHLAHFIDMQGLFLILKIILFNYLICFNPPASPPSHRPYLALLVPAPGEDLALPRQHQIEGVPRRYLHNVRPMITNNMNYIA